MFKNLRKVFGGDPIGRELERCADRIEAINALEPELRALSDEALRARTDVFRRRLADGESLDDLLVESFAVAREASLRTIGLRPFDVQLVGGILLHEGKIAEMRTGEGKTLVATLPIYLNALERQGVHLVTVNDYLARRDARWMGPLFHLLGLSVGVLQEASRTENGHKAFVFDPARESAQEDVHLLRMVDRAEAYAADVTYGTNNEFGFDYLRDNMAQSLEGRVQRGHHYVILDEVDNILIDEARTPLIISGPSHEDPEMYERIAAVVKGLVAEDYEVSERDRSVSLTELGEEHLERLVGSRLRDPERPEDITPEQARLLGFVEQALRAEHLFKRNKDYVVQGGRVIIVDEFTGRLMAGRRWSDGLHQAVEAKEGVKVREDNVTYATITLQNYFRKYGKLAGMTGTAVTEAEEFHKIYNVEVASLPTNLEYIGRQPESGLVEASYEEDGQKHAYFARREDPEKAPVFWRRKDMPDLVYRTEEAKLRAVSLEILRRHVRGQPLLVGTTSVELSERLSNRLRAQALQDLAMVEVLREAYLEAHSLENDGTRVEALQPLHAPLSDLGPSVLRPMAKELNLPLNPNRPENLERLLRLLGLEDDHRATLEAALTGGIRHTVLNAKKHDEESAIIAGAGGLAAVTIATNMAGRGVDIKLGGEVAEEVLGAVNRILRRAGVDAPEGLTMAERAEAVRQAPESAVGIYGAERDLFLGFVEDEEKVRQVGGLHVIGSVRHEARRIDNQLRGRAARQGDPGSSQFFLSLEDELMRLFGGARVSGLMEFLKIDDSVPIAASMVNRTIEETQRRVEGANFDTRKHLLEYDDVLNQQREVFYGQRNRVFTKDDLAEDIEAMLSAEVDRHVGQATQNPEEAWKLLAWLEETQPTLNLDSQRPYPSFMIRLLIDSLGTDVQAAAARAGLLDLARVSLEAQRDHLMATLTEQLDRSVERLEDQVRQRTDVADTAIEGTLLEAEEQGQPVDALALVRTVEEAAGVRLQMGEKGLRDIRESPEAFRKMIPRMVEGGLGIRVWTGLVQLAEARLGEPMGMDNSLATPIDWPAAERRLLDAAEQAWSRRSETTLKEVEQELLALLPDGMAPKDALLARALVRMSYGQRTLFDRRTHQRRAVVVARLSYAFPAAGFLEDRDPDELRAQVLDHLRGAQGEVESSVGRAELRRSGGRLADLPDRVQAGLARQLGTEAWEELRQVDSLDAQEDGRRATLEQALGHVLLNEMYRGLIQAVGDRQWIDYLTQMEGLRTAIGLEAYGQRDPLVQYKSRAFDMFSHLQSDIRAAVVARLFRSSAPPRPAVAVPGRPAPGEDSPLDQVTSLPSEEGARKKRRKRH
ncbi:MAG: secA [Anaerolineales bacterium]|nr:secA [Anaerolineales bacterium]